MAKNSIELSIQSFSYHGTPQLKDIQLEVKAGECIVLTGLSGCGKTTLLRAINGLIPDFYEGEFKGQVKILGKDIREYEKGELAKYMGNVFQNPKDQFFSTIAEDEVALVGENLGMERERLKCRVKEVMEEMDIGKLKDKSVFEMSGGERQKVAIATTMVYDTEIILLDEPSASLDYFATLELKDTLKKLKAMGKTIIVAEHRLFYLKELWDRLVIMENQTIGHILTREELTEEMRISHQLRCFDENKLQSERPPATGKERLRVHGLQIQRKGKVLMESMDFSLAEGECMGIIGGNGVGKSTMAKQLSGLLPIKKGSVSYGRHKKKRLKNTYYVLQDADSQLFSDTVENELIPKSKRKDRDYLDRVKTYLIEGNLWEKRLDHPQEMSSGEKQRLALLTALVEKRSLLILDEPTSGLDFKRMDLVAKLIQDASKEVPILIITHDTELLFKACNTVLMMGNEDYKKIPIQGNEDRIMEFLNHQRA
ncbi:MAG: ABC transporter ATP-binding protein [Tissierellia bacterium]|nr:ABC transporter ATP-binding protein [Tissierellia bacterium]